jgi:hypothetical protein
MKGRRFASSGANSVLDGVGTLILASYGWLLLSMSMRASLSAGISGDHLHSQVCLSFSVQHSYVRIMTGAPLGARFWV